MRVIANPIQERLPGQTFLVAVVFFESRITAWRPLDTENILFTDFMVPCHFPLFICYSFCHHIRIPIECCTVHSVRPICFPSILLRDMLCANQYVLGLLSLYFSCCIFVSKTQLSWEALLL